MPISIGVRRGQRVDGCGDHESRYGHGRGVVTRSCHGCGGYRGRSREGGLGAGRADRVVDAGRGRLAVGGQQVRRDLAGVRGVAEVLRDRGPVPDVPGGGVERGRGLLGRAGEGRACAVRQVRMVCCRAALSTSTPRLLRRVLADPVWAKRLTAEDRRALGACSGRMSIRTGDSNST